MKPTILVVDDEPTILENYPTDILPGIEAKIQTENCGEDAWEFLQDNAVSLIISDMNMPDGSGEWLLGNVKRLDPQPPFLFLSSGPNGPSRFFKMGAQGCFLKTPEGFKLLHEFVELWFKHINLYRSTWG